MDLQVVLPTGREIHYNVGFNITIKELKNEIGTTLQTKSSNIKLVSKGNILSDDSILNTQKVEAEFYDITKTAIGTTKSNISKGINNRNNSGIRRSYLNKSSSSTSSNGNKVGYGYGPYGGGYYAPYGYYAPAGGGGQKAYGYSYDSHADPSSGGTRSYGHGYGYSNTQPAYGNGYYGDYGYGGGGGWSWCWIIGLVIFVIIIILIIAAIIWWNNDDDN